MFWNGDLLKVAVIEPELYCKITPNNQETNNRNNDLFKVNSQYIGVM